MDELLHFIDGEWRRGSGGDPRPNRNPAHADRVLNAAHAGTPEDAVAAIDAAERAFRSWRETPAPERGKIVQKAAQILEGRRMELARAGSPRAQPLPCRTVRAPSGARLRGGVGSWVLNGEAEGGCA